MLFRLVFNEGHSRTVVVPSS